MSTSSKLLDVSFLAAHGYSFGAKVSKNSLSKVKLGDKTLACKVISRKKATNEDEIHRLEILRKISHPHIIGVHSVVQNSDFIFAFMPWIDEGNLMTHIKQNGMVKEARANLWFYQMVCAVKYLHNMNYAHCNLTCDCVLISKENIKISGLNNIKRVTRGDKVHVVSSKSVAAYYSPPEMNERLPCDPLKCDVFALGSILFIMLNAAVPFIASDPLQLVYDQMNKRFKLRASNICKLSVDCQVMIHTLLEPNADIRWNIETIHGMKWISKFIDKCQGDF